MAWYGRLEYAQALCEMQRLRECMVSDASRPGALILCEHPPTITCGKHSKAENVLLSPAECERRGIALVQIERGGDVTYHGPGQLMVYPVVRVGVKVRAFLEDVAHALADVAADFGEPNARWDSSEAGLWVGARKLAACGLNLKHGVSIHGFALNVSTPPEAWHSIVPCGLVGASPVSLAEASGRSELTPQSVAGAAVSRLHQCLVSYGLDPAARADLP